jgi:hypothetical protein
MIRYTLFVCSLGTVVDQRTNNLSLFDIVQQVRTFGLPFLVPKVCVTAMATRDQDDPDPDARLVATMGDQSLVETKFPIMFQGAKHTRCILEIGGLVVSSLGDLVFSLQERGAELAKYVIEVSALEKPTTEEVKMVPPPSVPSESAK